MGSVYLLQLSNLLAWPRPFSSSEKHFFASLLGYVYLLQLSKTGHSFCTLFV
jgi:hypothetical protein